MPIKINLKGKSSWRRSSSIVVGFEGYFIQGWGKNRALQAQQLPWGERRGLFSQRAKVRSGVLGDKARMQEGGHHCRCRPQPELPVCSHNKHVLSIYCMPGTISHPEPVDESGGK